MFIRMSSGTTGFVSYYHSYMETPLCVAPRSWHLSSFCRPKHGASRQTAWSAGRRHRSRFAVDACCCRAIHAQSEKKTRTHQQDCSVHRRDFTDRISRKSIFSLGRGSLANGLTSTPDLWLDFWRLRHYIDSLWIRYTPR